jgi:pimeloyl-ACP methyl ester carboxylesterase
MPTVSLPDGRSLLVHEYGDPAGAPCVYVPGTPASGLSGRLYDVAARAAGVRLLAVDKPGYGGSSYQPGRTLVGFAADVEHVADRLGLHRFAVVGESGGGPHALAVALALPARVTVAVTVAGMGPPDEAWVLEGMQAGNRRLVTLARRAPWAVRLPMALTRRALLNDKRRERFVAATLAKAGPGDARALRAMAAEHDVTASARDALRDSSRGAAQELAVLSRAWGFDPADIRCRVELWHGSEDVNVPAAVADGLAEQIPDAIARVIQGEGHAVGWSRRRDLMATVARAAADVSA